MPKNIPRRNFMKAFAGAAASGGLISLLSSSCTEKNIDLDPEVEKMVDLIAFEIINNYDDKFDSINTKFSVWSDNHWRWKKIQKERESNPDFKFDYSIDDMVSKEGKLGYAHFAGALLVDDRNPIDSRLKRKYPVEFYNFPENSSSFTSRGEYPSVGNWSPGDNLVIKCKCEDGFSDEYRFLIYFPQGPLYKEAMQTTCHINGTNIKKLQKFYAEKHNKTLSGDDAEGIIRNKIIPSLIRNTYVNFVMPTVSEVPSTNPNLKWDTPLNEIHEPMFNYRKRSELAPK